MQLSSAIATMAMILGAIAIAGHAVGEDSTTPPAARQTQQERLDARELARRAAVVEQKKRKQAFDLACNKPLKSEAEVDSCRAAYKRLKLE